MLEPSLDFNQPTDPQEKGVDDALFSHDSDIIDAVTNQEHDAIISDLQASGLGDIEELVPPTSLAVTDAPQRGYLNLPNPSATDAETGGGSLQDLPNDLPPTDGSYVPPYLQPFYNYANEMGYSSDSSNSDSSDGSNSTGMVSDQPDSSSA